MTIAVTGVNGFIGSHLAEHFLSAGHEVKGLVRRTSNLRWIESLPISLVYGDLADAEALTSLCRDSHIVVHCAARTTAPTPEAMMEANVAGTERLLSAAGAESVSRVVFLSSQEAVGPPPTDEPITEGVPLRPITTYGRSKARAEDLVRAADVDSTILRPGPVYGPRDTDVYLYFKIIDRGIRPIPPGPNRISVCSWRSLVDAVRGAAASEPGRRGVYFVSDGGSFDWAGLTRAIADAMNVDPPAVRLPRLSLKLASSASRLYSALTGTVSILNHEKLRMLEVENLTLSVDAARRELGFTPDDTAEALKQTVSWYREQGWLRRR